MTETEIVVGPPPSAVMVQLLGGFQVSQAIYVVAELGVATILEQEGPKTVAELAERTGAQREPLHRLLRVLAALGVFATEGEYVTVTPVGATLSEKHPQSLHGIARMWMETHYLPFSELGHSVRTGRPGSDKYLGEPFFDWIGADAQREVLFSQAMADITSSLRTGMFDGYQLPPGRVVADIGGSDGSVLVELLTRDGDAERRGILFDRPTTVPAAEGTLAEADLTNRVEVVAGDFFIEVPSADIYVLSYILHDWNDQENRRILASIAAAAAPGARLLIIEGVVPDGDEPHLTKAIDLTMLGMLTGKERSEQEYRDLLDSSGFTLDRIVATPSPFSILEATLR
ncbi:acetylserotonin O-methyltransferase [Nocardia sp. NBC_01499]|uniref:methyltransferase n=1 Tax=Nocardia sp. NBC_01499 TaxID=2903597 RepID=UPI0038640265